MPKLSEAAYVIMKGQMQGYTNLFHTHTRMPMACQTDRFASQLCAQWPWCRVVPILLLSVGASGMQFILFQLRYDYISLPAKT